MRRLVLIVAAALVAALMTAPGAFAAGGTFTWAEPGNFTATGTGANPDHDAFGGTPWLYEAGSSSTSLAKLTTFGKLADGLTGWSDSSASEVAPNGKTLTVGAGSTSDDAALQWTNPTGQTAKVTVTGTVAALTTSGCGTGLGQNGGYSWTLLQGTTTLASGDSGSAGTISQSASVAAKGTLTLLIAASGAGLLGNFSSACAQAGVSLSIAVPASTAPAVTLTTPTAGSSYVNPAQPTFAGIASDGFGYSPTVSIAIYSGQSATGTAVQTLTATESAGKYTVTGGPLGVGVYTAVASQSDLASPATTATSTPVSFSVAAPSTTGGGGGGGTGSGSGGTGSFVLNAPTGTLTSTPTITGSAPTADAGNGIALLVFSGTSATGTAARDLTGTIASDGTFSFTVSPALSDGIYTIEAVQSISGTVTATSPLEILIKTAAPKLTLISPYAGGTSGTTAVMYGLAGNVAGDSSTVTVALYEGNSTSGTLVGTDNVTRSGGGWAAVWPKKLGLGIYTIVASQTDVVGHRTTTAAHTFLVVNASDAVIGSPVAVSQNGTGSVPVTCAGHVNTRCSGTVRVVTTKPVKVGGKRATRTLFSTKFSMYASSTLVVRASIKHQLAVSLRRLGRVAVKVTVTLKPAGGKTTTYTAARTATIAR